MIKMSEKHQNCKHEKVVKSHGQMVCKDCGEVLDTVFMSNPSSSILSQSYPQRVVKHTYIGRNGTKKLKPKYNRLRYTQQKMIPYDEKTERNLHIQTMRIISALGITLQLHTLQSLLTYVCSVYKRIRPRTLLRRIEIFIPAILFIGLKDLKISVSLNEILSVSDTDSKKLNRAIYILRTIVLKNVTRRDILGSNDTTHDSLRAGGDLSHDRDESQSKRKGEKNT